MSDTLASPTVRPRLVPLRIGLILAVILTVLSALGSVQEIGFNGTGWDVVVVVLAVGCPLIAVVTIVLSILAWRGRRGPALGVVVALVASALTALTVFFLPAGVVPVEAIITVVVTIVITLAVAVLVAFGARIPR